MDNPENTASKLVDDFFPAVDRPDDAIPVYVVTITDKQAFIKAVAEGKISDEYLFINTDSLTDLAHKVNGNIHYPGIKVSDEKAA